MNKWHFISFSLLRKLSCRYKFYVLHTSDVNFFHRQVLSKPLRYQPTIAAKSEYLNSYIHHLMPTDFACFAHFVQQNLR